MFKWGTTQMKVAYGTYKPPYPVLNIQEIDLIPVTVDTPATSIQTGGRGRKRTAMKVIVDTYAEYDSFYADYLTSQVKILELKDGVTLSSAMISGMGLPEFRDPWIEFEIGFMEV